MKKQYFLEFNFEDINSFNTLLSDQLLFKHVLAYSKFERNGPSQK